MYTGYIAWLIVAYLAGGLTGPSILKLMQAGLDRLVKKND